jgi:hypothetical protein
MKPRTRTVTFATEGDDRLGAKWRKCDQCGAEMAIVTEDQGLAVNAEYVCPVHGHQVTVSTRKDA